MNQHLVKHKILFSQIIVVALLLCFSMQNQLNAQGIAGQDTFANSISEYFGFGFRSPATDTPSHTLGNGSGGTDLYVGLQYNRAAILGTYVFVRLGAVRYQNKVDYTKSVDNVYSNLDSIYLENVITEYAFTNSFLMTDAGLGIGKVVRHRAWALDANISAVYRAFTFISGNKINALEESVEFTEIEFTIPSPHLIFSADIGLRWYMDKEAYFTFGLGYQLTADITHTMSGANFDFSSLAYKVGYGFDF